MSAAGINTALGNCKLRSGRGSDSEEGAQPSHLVPSLILDKFLGDGAIRTAQKSVCVSQQQSGSSCNVWFSSHLIRGPEDLPYRVPAEPIGSLT